MRATGSLPLSGDQMRAWRADGFLVLRGVFRSEEIATLLEETERLLAGRRDLIDPLNLRCRFMAHVETGEKLFEVFDPVNDVSAVCERFASDPRVLTIVESLLGEPACLFKEKLIFKPPGATGYDLHQDIPQYWEGFPRTFLTVLIAIDPARPENGCTEVFSGYHHDFIAPPDRPDLYMLPDDAVDPGRCVRLILDPGDIAIFHGLTPHRSGPNRSSGLRRAFYVSYNALSDGGDQRAAHYRDFQERMRQRLDAEGTGRAYFR